MVLQSIGAISLSQIQTEFGGSNPISMSEYYTNANPTFTAGTNGIPASTAPLNAATFQGKSRPKRDGTIAGTPLQVMYNGLQPYLSNYKNANFYEYTLDGDSTYIKDGLSDMYDLGNYTQIMADSVTSSSLSYSSITETVTTVNGKQVSYLSLGYARPLIMLAKSSTRAIWGFSKSGNLGADGQGSKTNFNVYTGDTINGFTVYAWCRHVYNAGDPSIGDLYFAIGDGTSTFYTTTMTTFDPNNTDSGQSSMAIDCANVLFGCILCSKPSGGQITVSECQAVLTEFISRLKNIITTGEWTILMYSNDKKGITNHLGSDVHWGNTGSSTWRSISATSTGAINRTSFGHGVGLYNSFFAARNIIKIALVDGTGALSTPASNSNYIIYDLVESTGSETIYDILKRLDNYNATTAIWANNDNLFLSPSVTNFTAGINGYSGALSSSSGTMQTNGSAVPDKFCIWGVNTASDNDVQVLCSYAGNLSSGKGDAWRGQNPSETHWSYWGNDWHINTQTQTIGSAKQTDPGLATGALGPTTIYVLAYTTT